MTTWITVRRGLAIAALALLQLGDGLAQSPNAAVDEEVTGAGSLRIGVSSGRFDDIAAVLSALKVPFKPLREAANPFQEFDVIFLSCGSDDAQRFQASSGLKTFVERGGVLYVSDLSATVLVTPFQEYIASWRSGGPVGRWPVKVTDKEFAKRFGQTMQLTFNAAGWMAPGQISKKVNVAIVAGLPDGSSVPVLISFQHGKGHVIFTAFHNHAGANAVEMGLIRSIIAAPVKTGIEVQATMRSGDDPDKLQALADAKRKASAPEVSLTAEQVKSAPISELISALQQGNSDTQKAVLQELHDRKGSDATAALAAAISIVSADRRQTVRELLASRMTRMNIDTLRSYLAKEMDVDIITSAIHAVRAKEERRLYAELILLLGHPRDPVGDAAHEALAQLTGQEFGRFQGESVAKRFEVARKWQAWLEQQAD